MTKVYNIESPRSARPVANQFIIETEEGKYFQSYNRVIAFIPKRIDNPDISSKIQLDKNYWDYSTTTGKYRNIFLGESKQETQEKIESGEYILADLNAD